MNAFIGHTSQREELASLVRHNRLPSAILLAGLRGIGKSLAACELASQMLCELGNQAPRGGCKSCRPCTLFAAGTHPDVHTVRCGKDEGTNVDDIRLLLEKMSLRAFMGGSKVAILLDADEISTVSANVILKSLEEPRPNNYFILTLANPSRLPSTILSRCQKFFFDRLSNSEVCSIVKQRGLPEVDDALILAADGSVAAVDSLQAHSEMLKDIRDVVEKAWLGDGAVIGRAALDWGGAKGSLRERISLLRSVIRANVLANTTDPASCAVWAHGLQNVLDLEHLIFDRHVNATLAILKVLQSCNRTLSHHYQSAPNSNHTIGELLLDGR